MPGVQRGCVAACIFAFLLISVAVAGAGPTHEERQTTANSPFLLPHAIEDHGRRFSGLTHANTYPLWDAQGSRTQLRKCQSKRKGAFIGAAIGTAVAGAFAVYVVKDLSGNVPGQTGAAPVRRLLDGRWGRCRCSGRARVCR